jgi:lipopolysaccharide transport system permease protein
MLREIAQDVWAGRGLAWRLFLRDLRAGYRQTLLGYVWAFLPPYIIALRENHSWQCLQESP